ncbi:MAG: TIGR04283 family arsenosugar biosynthesis glycosyltransferase [Anaerolineae bacterium]
MLISVIIPVLNEAETIARCIAAARQDYAPGEVEIIVADGGSVDGTQELIPTDVTLVKAPQGRGIQMNRGADLARGEVLVFCHADTRLPHGWREAVLKVLDEPGVSGGGFQRIFEPARGFVHIINHIKIGDNWRLLHGDRAQFMSRATFEAVGGFPEIPLMEDVEMARALHEQGQIRMVPLPLQVISSSRRLLERGAFRQYCLTGWYRFRYFYLGATPEDIARVYRSGREDLVEVPGGGHEVTIREEAGRRAPWGAAVLLSKSEEVL